MNSVPLKEYRCKCGKLLFKGVMALSLIEVKCRRCGAVNSFRSGRQESPVSFSITTNSSGKIVGACRAAFLLEVFRKDFLGKNIGDLFPSVRSESVLKGESLTMRNNFLPGIGGAAKEMESYMIPYFKNGKLDGYHIFNRLFIS